MSLPRLLPAQRGLLEVTTPDRHPWSCVVTALLPALLSCGSVTPAPPAELASHSTACCSTLDDVVAHLPTFTEVTANAECEQAASHEFSCGIGGLRTPNRPHVSLAQGAPHHGYLVDLFVRYPEQYLRPGTPPRQPGTWSGALPGQVVAMKAWTARVEDAPTPQGGGFRSMRLAPLDSVQLTHDAIGPDQPFRRSYITRGREAGVFAMWLNEEGAGKESWSFASIVDEQRTEGAAATSACTSCHEVAAGRPLIPFPTLDSAWSSVRSGGLDVLQGWRVE